MILVLMRQNLTWSSLNLITGNIPPNIGWCQNLTYLDVSDNNLSGSIPSSIGDLKQPRQCFWWKVFIMHDDRLFPLPIIYFLLIMCFSLQLKWFYFSYTYLRLEINMWIERKRVRDRSALSFIHQSYYKHLILVLMRQNLTWSSLNLITGNIPPNIGWCQNLTYLDVSYNHLIGGIPSSIGDLKQLQTLYLEENQLTGKPCNTQTYLNFFSHWCAHNEYYLRVYQLRHVHI